MSASIPPVTHSRQSDLSPVSRLLYLVLIAIPLANLLVNAISLVRFGIDLPYLDDWRQYDKGNLGNLDLGYLFTPVNDTLYPVGRLLDGLAFRWFDDHAVVYQLITLLGVLGGLLLLQWRLLSLCVENPLHRALAFCFTLPMLQPESYWGLQNIAYHQALPLVAMLGILWLAIAPTIKPRVAAFVAALLGAIAGLTYISGAFAGFVLAIVFIVLGHRWGRMRHVAQDQLIAFGERLALMGRWLMIPAFMTVLAQLWVIVIVQKGVHRSDAAMAFPWEWDFWAYTLGKVGRALLLQGVTLSWSLAATLVVLVVAAVIVFLLGRDIWMSPGKMHNAQAAGDSRVGTTQADAELRRHRAALVLFSLIAITGIYLAMVAAGRTNLRPETADSFFDVFHIGFLRFHFFWVTLLWPWLAAVAIMLAQGDSRTVRTTMQRVVIGSLSALLVVMLFWGPTFAHWPMYRAQMQDRDQGLACLNEKIAQGIRPLVCPSIEHGDLTASVRNAVRSGASFVEGLDFPVEPLGATSDVPTFNLLEHFDRAELENIHLVSGTVSEDPALEDQGTPLVFESHNTDPIIVFSTGDADTMKDCSIIDVAVRVTMAGPDGVQFFYVKGDESQFSEESSVVMPTAKDGEQTLNARIISPTGFSDKFRLDPGSQPGKIILHGMELRCRF